jgi:Holliday junction resolvase RusA-like endonuclease
MKFYDRANSAVYSFKVGSRPSIGSFKGKAAYQLAVADAARSLIESPIESHDVEVEIFYSSRTGAVLDIDNVVKPTLDALCGIAYVDDRQVRAVRAIRFDRTKPLKVDGSIEQIEALILGASEHVVWIDIYSDERLKALVAAKVFVRNWRPSLGRRVNTRGESQVDRAIG